MTLNTSCQNSNPNNRHITEVSAPPALKMHKGARHRKSGGHVAEITHAGQKIWLGTFDTIDEAALAYDLAAQRLKGATYNFELNDENQIITTINHAKQAEIAKKVGEKLEGPTSRSNNVDQKAGTSHKNKRTHKSGNEELRRKPKAQKKRKVEKKERAVELDGFL